MTATEPALHLPLVLRRAWQEPFKTRSDFARHHAESVAACASLGFITTRVSIAHFGRTWVLTPAGLSHLWVAEGFDE